MELAKAIDHTYSKPCTLELPNAKKTDRSEIADPRNVCRACLSTKNLSNMYERRNRKMSGAQLYQALCRVKVQRNDGLSQFLCNSCMTYLIEFRTFLRKCHKSEEQLKKARKSLPGDVSDDSDDATYDDIRTEQPISDRSRSTEIRETRSKGPYSITSKIRKTPLESHRSISSKFLEPCTNSASPVDAGSSDSPKLNERVTNTAVQSDLLGSITGELKIDIDQEFDVLISYLADRPKSAVVEVKEDPPGDSDSGTRNVNKLLTHSCICGNNYLNSKEFFGHKMETRHSDATLYRCEYCGKVCPNKVSYMSHKRVHTKEKPYICDTCGMRFSLPGNLRRHCRRAHLAGIKYICSKCGKEFSRNDGLKRHEEAKHSEAQDLLCNICGAKFFGRQSLVKHLRRHNRNRTPARLRDPAFFNREDIAGSDSPTSIQCKECNKYLASHKKLKLHMEIHYEVECPKCQRRFTSLRAMELHRRVHSPSYTGRRARYPTGQIWKCRFCGKLFGGKHQLDYHENAHTGRRPFKCETCGREWTQPSHLRRHMKLVHVEEKPHVCPLCGKGYVDKVLLETHTNAHLFIFLFIYLFIHYNIQTDTKSNYRIRYNYDNLKNST